MNKVNPVIEDALKTIKNPDLLSAHLSAMSQLCDLILNNAITLDGDSRVDFVLNVKLMCSSIAKLRDVERLLLVANQTEGQR